MAKSTDWNGVGFEIEPLSIRNYRAGKWDAWLKQFRELVSSLPSKDRPNREMVDLLLRKLGPEVIPISNSFNVDLCTISFEKLIERFTMYFNPLYARSVFWNTKQLPNETFEQFAVKLSILSGPCDFGSESLHEKCIRDVFLANMLDKYDYIRTRIRNVYADPDLKQTIEYVREMSSQSQSSSRNIALHSNNYEYERSFNNSSSGFRFPNAPKRTNESLPKYGLAVSPGDSLEVTVISIHDNLVHVLPVGSAGMREKLDTDLNRAVVGRVSRPVKPEKRNNYCVMLKGSWYRARVIDVDEEKRWASVHSLDYGWQETIHFSDFVNTPLDFLVVEPIILQISFEDRWPNNIKEKQCLHVNFLKKKNNLWSVSLDDSPREKNKGFETNSGSEERRAPSESRTNKFDGDVSIRRTMNEEPVDTGINDVASSSPTQLNDQVSLRISHPPPIPSNSFTAVKIVYCGPEGTFVTPEAEYNSMLDIFQTLFNGDYTPCEAPRLQEMYVAPFDGIPHRAKVLAIDWKNYKCHVVFVDFGNESDVNLNELYYLPTSLNERIYTFQIRLDSKFAVQLKENEVVKVTPVALESDGSWFVQLKGEHISDHYHLPDPSEGRTNTFDGDESISPTMNEEPVDTGINNVASSSPTQSKDQVSLRIHHPPPTPSDVMATDGALSQGVDRRNSWPSEQRTEMKEKIDSGMDPTQTTPIQSDVPVVSGDGEPQLMNDPSHEPPCPLDCYTNVMIMNILTDGVAYVMLSSDEERFADVLEQLLIDSETQDNILLNPMKGSKCAVPYDHGWWRAEVVGVKTSKEMVKVILLDSGDTEIFSFSQIKILPKELEHLPPFCFKIKGPKSFSFNRIDHINIKPKSQDDDGSWVVAIKEFDGDESIRWTMNEEPVDTGINNVASSSPTQSNDQVSLRIPHPPPIPSNSFTAVKVVYCGPEGTFVIPEAEYNSMLDIFQTLFNGDYTPCEAPRLQEMYVAPFDGIPHRAKVLAIDWKNYKCHVVFVDFGNESDVNLKELYNLPTSLNERIYTFQIRLDSKFAVQLKENEVVKVTPVALESDGSWFVQLEGEHISDHYHLPDPSEGRTNKFDGDESTSRTMNEEPVDTGINNVASSSPTQSKDQVSLRIPHPPPTPSDVMATDGALSQGVDRRNSWPSEQRTEMKEEINSGMDPSQTTPIQSSEPVVSGDGEPQLMNDPNHEPPCPLDCYTNVMIMNILTDGVAYVMLTSEGERFGDVLKLLLIDSETQDNILLNPMKGSKCVVPYDYGWWRAEVVGVKTSKEMVKVILLDSGVTEMFSFSQLKILPKELEHLPPFCFKIKGPKSFSFDGIDYINIKPKSQDDDGSWVVAIKEFDGDESIRWTMNEEPVDTGINNVASSSPTQSNDQVSLRIPHPPPIPSNSFTAVKIVYCGPEGTFVTPETEYDSMIDIFQTVANGDYTPCEAPRLQEMYVAPFDGIPHRAKVLAIDWKNYKCHVVFVDFGNESDVNLKELYNLPTSLNERIYTFQIRLDSKFAVQLKENEVVKVTPVALESDGSWFVQLEGEHISDHYHLPDPSEGRTNKFNNHMDLKK